MTNSLNTVINKSKELPALSDYTVLRYFNFIALYIAQGIPEGMTLFGIPAWMAMNGKTPGEIGSFVAVFSLPWSFKIIVAPLMDRFTFLPMGRRRPWVLFGQLGLVLSFIAMAMVPDPLNNLGMLTAAGFAIGFFGAIQDCATDGMAIDIVPVNQQAKANGLMWGAKIIGTSVSLSLGTWLLGQYNFMTAILMLSILVALVMLVPLFLKERPGEKLLPWTKGTASPETQKMQLESFAIIFNSLFNVLSLRNSLLLAILLFIAQGAYNFISTLLPIFTVQALGWTNQSYSNFFAIASLIGGIGGMLIGGFLIQQFGKIRMMNIYFLLFIVITIGLAFLKMYWTANWLICSFMILFQLLFVFACIGIFAISMECCWKKVSASQFTLYMTIGNLGRIAGAKIIGPIKENFGWEYTILMFAVFIALAWISLQFLNIKQHVNRLEELAFNDTQ